MTNKDEETDQYNEKRARARGRERENEGKRAWMISERLDAEETKQWSSVKWPVNETSRMSLQRRARRQKGINYALKKHEHRPICDRYKHVEEVNVKEERVAWRTWICEHHVKSLFVLSVLQTKERERRGEKKKFTKERTSLVVDRRWAMSMRHYYPSVCHLVPLLPRLDVTFEFEELELWSGRPLQRQRPFSVRRVRTTWRCCYSEHREKWSMWLGKLVQSILAHARSHSARDKSAMKNDHQQATRTNLMNQSVFEQFFADTGRCFILFDFRCHITLETILKLHTNK